MKTIKICHIVYSFGTGGLEKGIATVINHGASDIEHTVLCLTTAGDSQQLLRKPVNIIELNKPGGNSLRFIGRLSNVLRKMKPDVVHTRNWSGIDGVIAARMAGIRSIVHGEHGWGVEDVDGRKRKRVLLRKLIFPWVREITCVSRQMVTWLNKDIGVPIDRITQIYNGIDCRQFKPASPSEMNRIRQELGIDQREFVIGIIGRLDPVKNHVTLFKAFSQIKRKIKEAVLLVVGEGAYREILQGAAGQGIRFLGNRKDVPQVLKALDVFVLPSLNEGISNTILEAMASGLPVVATSVGGTPEIIDNGKTGTMVAALDTTGITREIIKYHDHPDHAMKHGMAGRKMVMDRFSIKNMVEEYERVWKTLGI